MLRNHLKIAGINQEEFASKIGMTRQNLNKYFNEKVLKPRFKEALAAIGMIPQELHRIESRVGELQYRHIVAIHKKLGVDLNWFIAGTIVRPKVADKRIEGVRNSIKKLAAQI